MAHPEPGQVWEQSRRVAERELAVQLQAIGGARDARAFQARGRLAPLALAAAPGLREAARHAHQSLGAPPCLHRQRELAAPVGMLVEGPRKVRLLGQTEHVLHLHHHHRAGRARGEGLHRVGDRVGGRPVGWRRGINQPLGGERGDQRGARLAPFRLRMGEPVRVQDLQARAFLEIAFLPPTAEGRQVVGPPRHQGPRRVRRWRLEAAALALEHHQPVAEDAAFVEARAEVVGHGSQVLADHEAARAVALERDDPEEVRGRVAHVGAVDRLHAPRHPPQARDAHHVVDAQRSRARHVGAQRGDEGRVTGVAQAPRHQWRQAPVLALAVELVGRGADAHAERVVALVGPRFRAIGGNRDREVGVEAHGHAGLAAGGLRVAELQVGLPLQVLVQPDLFRMLVAKASRPRALGLATVVGPLMPAAAVVHREGLVQRVAGKGRPARLAEARERTRSRRGMREVIGAEVLVQHLEGSAQRRGHARVVDLGWRAESLGRSAPFVEERAVVGDDLGEVGDRLHVDAQGIQE
jgi:hypothetical protein